MKFSINTNKVSFVLFLFFFTISNKKKDLNAKGVIVRALDQFRVKSCIDFKVWNSELYYLKIQKLDGYVFICFNE